MKQLVQVHIASLWWCQDSSSAPRIPKPWPKPQSLSPQATPRSKNTKQHLETRGEEKGEPGPKWPPGSQNTLMPTLTLAFPLTRTWTHPTNKYLLTISKDQAPGVSAGRIGSCLWPFLHGSLAHQMSLCHLTISRGFSLSS